MLLNFFKTKKGFALLVVALTFIFIFTVKFVIDYRVQLAWLAPENTTVSEERLNKDISTILTLYGLKKDRSDLIVDSSNLDYKKYCEDGTDKKGLFIHADPILYGSSRNYTEVETFMEIWLYVMAHNFDCEIDGILYYFNAPSLDSIFAPLRSSEMYMSRDDFMSLYKEFDIDGLSHPKKVKALAEAYVEETKYKRNSGHVQVKE